MADGDGPTRGSRHGASDDRSPVAGRRRVLLRRTDRRRGAGRTGRGPPRGGRPDLSRRARPRALPRGVGARHPGGAGRRRRARRHRQGAEPGAARRGARVGRPGGPHQRGPRAPGRPGGRARQRRRRPCGRRAPDLARAHGHRVPGEPGAA